MPCSTAGSSSPSHSASAPSVPERRERLTCNLVFRATPTIAAAYRASARAADQSLGDWIRGHLPIEARTTGRPTPGAGMRRRTHVHADPELLRSLAAIGNNINQLAKAVNRDCLTGRSPGTSLDYITQLVSIDRQLGELLRRHISDRHGPRC